MLINGKPAILLDKENLLEELTSIENELHRGEIFDAVKHISEFKKQIYEQK